MESALLGAARETPGLGCCAGRGNPSGAEYKNDVRSATGNHKIRVVPKCSENLYHDNAGRCPQSLGELAHFKNFAGLPVEQVVERMIELSLYVEEKLKSM